MFKWSKKNADICQSQEPCVNDPCKEPSVKPTEVEVSYIKDLQIEGKRVPAIQKLAELKSESAAEPLIELLRSLPPNKYNAELRLEIIQAMGKIGDSRFVDPLIECLNDQSEPPGSNEMYRVSCNASYYLGKIGSARAIAPLSAILQNTYMDYYSRCMAARALGLIDDPGSIKALESVKYDSNQSVRDKVLSILKTKNKL